MNYIYILLSVHILFCSSFVYSKEIIKSEFEKFVSYSYDVLNDESIISTWMHSRIDVCLLDASDGNITTFTLNFLNQFNKKFQKKIDNIIEVSELSQCGDEVQIIAINTPERKVSQKQMTLILDDLDKIIPGAKELVVSHHKKPINDGIAHVKFFDKKLLKSDISFLIVRSDKYHDIEYEIDITKMIYLEELFHVITFGRDIHKGFLDSILYESLAHWRVAYRKYMKSVPQNVKKYKYEVINSGASKLCKLDIMLLELLFNQVGKSAPFSEYRQVIEDEFDDIQAAADAIMADPAWKEFVDPDCGHVRG